MSAHQYDEGHTVAGWTGFGIAAVGSAVAGLGVCLVSAPLIAGGLAVTAVSVLVTWALHLTGWGKPPGRRPRAEWGMRVRDSGARQGHPGCVGCRLAGRGAGGSGSTAVEAMSATALPGRTAPDPAAPGTAAPETAVPGTAVPGTAVQGEPVPAESQG
ncbi:HGxxPAAW family protein [Streptomyces sp. SID13726]|uniref:HGxxPAAW family protein n=1 Tax=Streptomyces sp. SID13726 TaxID=2706058 RepID=UPI0031BA9B87